MMSRLRARRWMLMAWALVWVCGTVSLDLLFDQNHALADSRAHHHHTCLVCQLGPQAAPPKPAVDAASLVAPAYRQSTLAFPNTTTRFIATSPQPLVPRGPPHSPFLSHS